VQFPGRRALSALLFSPLILPAIVMGAAILQYASALGFARTFGAVLVGHAVIVIPYVVRTTLAALVGFDPSLEEAARDLGDSGLGAFFRITLPLIKPGVIAGALFAVIISWINVELSMFNTTAELMTIPVKLFNYIQYSVDPMIAAVSAGTIYVAIVVVVMLDLTVGIDKAASMNR
jgi:putative spermidine/putrescine transport system permease protein